MKQIWGKLMIGKKLIISFLLVTILSGSSGVISLVLMKSADTQYSYALINYGFSQGDIGLLMSALKDNTANILMTMATDDPVLMQKAVQEIQSNSEKINQYMANVEQTLIGDKEKEYYKIIADNLPLFTQHSQEVLSLANQNRDKEAMEVYQNDAVEHIQLIEEAMQSLMDSNQTIGGRLSEQLTRESFYTIVFMCVLTVASFVISLCLATFIARSVSKPMKAFAERLVALSQGDLNSPVPLVDSQDETGILAGATEELVGRLKVVISQMTSVLGSIADGNLDVEYTRNFSGDFSPLHTSSTQIIDSLNEAFRMINQSADQVDSGADQVSSGAQALSQGSTEQASSIEELAATISEISGEVKKNAENAKQARLESEKQGENLNKSNEKMHEMVSAMDKINDKSGEIGKIIKTIEDIAFQTNILALNAAVEAARAGNAGKGFAVVADEVRNLAGKSAEAAKNTTGLIEETIEAVKNGTSLASITAESLEEVVDSSRRVTVLVNMISESSDNQANSISQVTQGVDQISSVVQTNSATAQESAAASEELAGQARMMKDMVGRFTIKK